MRFESVCCTIENVFTRRGDKADFHQCSVKLKHPRERGILFYQNKHHTLENFKGTVCNKWDQYIFIGYVATYIETYVGTYDMRSYVVLLT